MYTYHTNEHTTVNRQKIDILLYMYTYLYMNTEMLSTISFTLHKQLPTLITFDV